METQLTRLDAPVLRELTFEEAREVIRSRGFDPDAFPPSTPMSWQERYRYERQAATVRALIGELALEVRWAPGT